MHDNKLGGGILPHFIGISSHHDEYLKYITILCVNYAPITLTKDGSGQQEC